VLQNPFLIACTIFAKPFYRKNYEPAMELIPVVLIKLKNIAYHNAESVHSGYKERYDHHQEFINGMPVPCFSGRLQIKKED
jgi:hypothetical protein